MPKALNCKVSATLIVKVVGVIAIVSNTAAVTVSVAVPLLPLLAAVMVVLPAV